MDMPQSDGSVQTISLRPILRNGATPYLLSNRPKYLSTEQRTTRPKRLDCHIERDLCFKSSN